MITEAEKNEYGDAVTFTLDDILAEFGVTDEIVSEETVDEAVDEAVDEIVEENVSIYRGDVDPDKLRDEYEISDVEDGDIYAEADIDYTEALEDLESRSEADPEEPEKPRRSFKDVLMNTLIRFLAFAAMRIRQSKISLNALAAEEEEDLGAELAPDRAALFYENYLPSLSFRTKLSFLFSALLLYISLGLPIFSSMQSPKVSAATCLVLLLCVMLCGIDILTAGVFSLIRRRPHANSLIALSCVFSMLDALITAVAGSDMGLPFCGAAALTLSFSLLGSVLNSRADRIVFRTAASIHEPYVLSADAPVSGEGVTLTRSKRLLSDFVRRTEEAGPDETAYGFMTPVLIIVSPVFAVIVCAVGKCFGSFFHILSGILAVAAPFTLLLSYPLPFFVSTKLLLKDRSAVAGWSGIYDIGKSKTVVITDRDLFPDGTVTVEKTRILDGADSAKVISLAYSIIAASDSAMTGAFSALMAKGGGSPQRVDEFTCHESGGLMALINGEEVLCGSAGFMQLMGIRVPESIAPKYAVFIAASGVVCGIFEMKYTPSEAVRKALVSLLRSSCDPIFAVRDFNINPNMLSLKYDIPTDGFDFPSYAERYEISSGESAVSGKPAAVMYRSGIDSLTWLSGNVRRLFTVIRLNVLLSLLSTTIGVVMLFTMFVGGNFDSASARTVIIYLLAWSLPQLALCFTLNSSNR